MTAPMRVHDIPRGLRRVGKLRMGEQIEMPNGKTRPAKLDTWRVTSGDELALRTVAAAYGGQVQPWDNNGIPEFEVVTDVAGLDVFLTPEEDAFSQAWELWSAGGCSRRCDGRIEQLSGEACKCPSDREERSTEAAKGKACKLTTRLSVVLPKVAALGAWMVESHGFYAAKELASTIDLLDMAGARRGLLPARLRIEQRVSRRDGKTTKYGVPVLDIGVTFEGLLSGRGVIADLAPAGVDATTGELTGPRQPELPAAAPAAAPPAPAEPTAPPAEPVTSTKQAGARKAAAAKKAAAPVDDTPMSPDEIAAVRARVALLDREHQSLNAQLMNNARITLKGGPPKRSEAKTIETILSSVEAKQAEAWEGRRTRVFAALAEYGFDDDARHQFIADATSGLDNDAGGPTESTRTLTEAQTTAIIVAAGEPAETTDEVAS